MDDGVDTGDILFQKEFSLNGNLTDIYKRIISIGTDGVIEIIEDGYQNRITQDEQKATYYKRRKPSQSYISINELKNKNSNYTRNDKCNCCNN